MLTDAATERRQPRFCTVHCRTTSPRHRPRCHRYTVKHYVLVGEKCSADVLELFKCIPPVERPYIQYSTTQKFPKIKRMTEVNALTGKYLELLLKRTNLRSKEEWLEVTPSIYAQNQN